MVKNLGIGGVLAAGLVAGSLVAREPLFDAKRVSENTRILSADAFEGRAPGTPGEEKTIAFLIAKMKAAGLNPGGPKGKRGRSWTQVVPLQQVDFSAPPVLAIAGKTVAQGEEMVLRPPLDGSTSADIGAAPMVFVGYGVTAPERNWDDFKGVDLRGKIMVVLVNDPDYEAKPGEDAFDQFGSRAMTYYGRWTYKYQEAARRGALGCLIIHEDAPASYPWQVVRTSNGGSVYDIIRKDPGAEHSAIEGWLQRSTAADLFKASGLDFEQMKQAARSRDFRPAPLAPTLSARYSATSRTVRSRNVLGLIPGRGAPNETLIYTAHWDHLGVGKPDAKGDTIYNGARDNASGTSMLIELARAFAAGERPRRSILFMAVTAEERGLLGSEYYASNPVYPLETTIANLNIDGMLGGGEARDFSLLGNPQVDLVEFFNTEAGALGRRYTPGARPEAGAFFRADSFSFAKKGVPAVSYFPGRDLIKGGAERGNALFDAYNRDQYHQPSDEWRADWDWGNAVPDLMLLHRVGWKLASGKSWPQWSAGSEFKGLRDLSSARRPAG